MDYNFKNYLIKSIIACNISNIYCSSFCRKKNNNLPKKVDNEQNNNNNNDEDEEKELKAKRKELLDVLKALNDENIKYGNIFDIDITEENIKESVYSCSNPDKNIEIIEDKFDKLKKIFEDEKLCSKKKELIALFNDLKIKNAQLQEDSKITFDLNKNEIFICTKDFINDLEKKLNNYKKDIENLLKTNKNTYQTIDEVITLSCKFEGLKIVFKEDKYIYLYCNFNQFAKSVNQFNLELEISNIGDVEFKIENKEDKFTFDKMMYNIYENMTKCSLCNILKDTYFLTLKFKDKDSYYKYDVSTNRDLVTNEKGYWFNYKDGNLGKYCYDPGSNQMGLVDEIDENEIKLVGHNKRREGNCYQQFLQGK